MIVLKKSDRKINQAVLMPVIDVDHFDFKSLEDTIQQNIILLNDHYAPIHLDKIVKSGSTVFVICNPGEDIKVFSEQFVFLFMTDFKEITHKVEKLSSFLSPESIRSRYEKMLIQLSEKLSNMESQMEFLQKGMEELSRTNSELMASIWNNENK